MYNETRVSESTTILGGLARSVGGWFGRDRDAPASATPELEGELPIEDDEPGAVRRIPAGLRYMAAGALFFSLMSLLVKIAGQRLPSQEVVLVRAVITLLLSWLALRGTGVDAWGNNRRLLVARGVVGFIALSAFYYAVIHLPLADATVIQYTNPVWAALLAVPILGERLERRVALAILASLAGVVLIAEPAFLFGSAADAGALDPGVVAIGLIGALGSGTAYVTVRKLRATEHPMVIVFYFALVSTVASIPLALPGALWPTPMEWLVLLGVGVTTQLGQVAITRGLHLERAGRATAVGYLQIVFAAVWGLAFFGERPDVGTLLGAALIVLSTLALVRQRPRQKSAGSRVQVGE